MKQEVYIIAAKRTATGGFLGELSNFTAPELGAQVIKDILNEVDINENDIDNVILGNVLSANLGQAPARQASIKAGIPDHAEATTINKVCSSGLKSVHYAYQAILLGESQLVVAGGMESMSNTPYYLENHRKGNKTSHESLVDGMLKDGLWDPYNNFHMGNAAELANTKYNISRQQQDTYALSSYQKAATARDSGLFDNEITPIKITTKKKEWIFNEDEDIAKLKSDKVPNLKPIFDSEGSVTAANASNLNDGAAILFLASKKYVEENNLKPIAKILEIADAAQAPEWFTTSPAIAVKKLLEKSKIPKEKIDYFEINEAYANVAIINTELLEIDPKKVNTRGGAIALGHPLGASGARILVTLTHLLNQNNGKYGIAAICNGGGGSSAILIENI